MHASVCNGAAFSREKKHSHVYVRALHKPNGLGNSRECFESVGIRHGLYHEGPDVEGISGKSRSGTINIHPSLDLATSRPWMVTSNGLSDRRTGGQTLK